MSLLGLWVAAFQSHLADLEKSRPDQSPAPALAATS